MFAALQVVPGLTIADIWRLSLRQWRSLVRIVDDQIKEADRG